MSTPANDRRKRLPATQFGEFDDYKTALFVAQNLHFYFVRIDKMNHVAPGGGELIWRLSLKASPR